MAFISTHTENGETGVSLLSIATKILQAVRSAGNRIFQPVLGFYGNDANLEKLRLRQAVRAEARRNVDKLLR